MPYWTSRRAEGPQGRTPDEGHPVFVYTARDAHYDRLAALELGADDYFEKPFDLELLMTRIEYRIWKRQHGE